MYGICQSPMDLYNSTSANTCAFRASWSPAHREEAEDALQMACEHGRETECMQQASVNYCEWADKLIDRQRKHLQTAQRNMDEFEQKLSALMADKLGPPTAITTPKPALQEMPCASDPKPNKPLLCWQTARACKGAHEHVLELQRKWAFWSQDFRPYMKADCKLNPKLAGWVDSDTQRRYSEQRPLFHEVVTKGAGNPQREEAVLAAMAKVLTIDKEASYDRCSLFCLDKEASTVVSSAQWLFLTNRSACR